ncbi:MAG: ArnT family glycosyltransferase [Thermodesulfobacteriota bacterium]
MQYEYSNDRDKSYFNSESGARAQYWLFALAIVLLTCITRLPSLLHPQAIDDEIVYSVVANEIVDGGRPYVDAVERKPPLLFWTYAAIFATTGKFNWEALHAVAVVWILCTMAGLYVIGRGLFDRKTGLVAALLYSVFQPWLTWKNLAFNGELLMNLPIVLAWAIALGRGSSKARPELLAAGALLCAGFLLKQPAAIAAVPLGVYVLLPSYRTSRHLTRTASVVHAAFLTIGFFATLGLVTAILWKQGILRDAFYWTISDHYPIPQVFWTKGVLVTLAFIGTCLPLFLGAAMACRDDAVWADKNAERMALFGLLVASAIGVASTGLFYPHYYIQLIPSLTLLAAPFYARLWTQRTQTSHWLLRPAVTYAWLALIVVAFSISHWLGLASQRELSAAGRYLSEHSTPADRIFVWGQEPKIYLDARRRPACRYIATFLLTGYVFGGQIYVFGEQIAGLNTRGRIMPGAWSVLEHDFARHFPAYIVDSQSFPGAQYPVRNFPILAHLLSERYRVVARTDDGVIYALRRGINFGGAEGQTK